jgi:hypothetical protein
MTTYSIVRGRVRPMTEPEELASTATKPGDLAQHLANTHGLARRFYPVDAWFVNLDTVTRVRLVEVRGSGIENCPPVAYALTDDGRLLPTFYLFPVNKHCKPRLATLRDDLGTCQQWVAPLRAGCHSAW